MGNKIVTIVSITLASFILLLTVALVSSSYQTRTTMSLVDDFVNATMYKGYFTENEYYELISKIPIRNSKVNLIRYPQNEFSHERADVLNFMLTGEILGGDTAYAFPSGVINIPNNYFRPGDIFRIDVIQLGSNNFETLLSILTGNGNPPFRMLVSRHTVIANVKYDETQFN